MRQRGIAGPEVVKRDLDARFAETRERVLDRGVVAEDDGLGDLHPENGGRQSELLQPPEDMAGEVEADIFRRRRVQRHAADLQALLAPVRDVA